MKYLVKTIKHTTGEEFTDIIKVKNNEDYVIVEAESKEEAEVKYNDLMQCDKCGSWNTEHGYLYLNSIPIHLDFSCNNCNKRYGKELVGDEKGFYVETIFE